MTFSRYIYRLIVVSVVTLASLSVTHASSLGNFVWIDSDADGQQDSIEVGYNGATVTLYSATGQIISTTTTSSTLTATGGNPGGLPGYYHFADLPVGSYSLQFSLPTGYTFTSKYSGAPESDSNADPTLGITGMYTLTDGEDNLTIDAGLVPIPVVVSGGGGGGGGSSTTSVSPIVSSTQVPLNPENSTGISETPTYTPKLVKKPLPIVVKVVGDDTLRFVLPKKLLDTGRSLKIKGIKILANAFVETMPQVFFPASTPMEAEKKLSSYLGNLPEQDRNQDRYVVIPSAGIIAPIQDMPEGIDRRNLISGKEIQSNPYLRNGVLHYPNSALPGELGNMILSGHSSYWKSDRLGRYKTVFGNLPTVDVGEEVWVYNRERDPTTRRLVYVLYRYAIRASYNTNPYDVDILLPEKGKKLVTLFTCTPIGGVSGRWIVRGELME